MYLSELSFTCIGFGLLFVTFMASVVLFIANNPMKKALIDLEKAIDSLGEKVRKK